MFAGRLFVGAASFALALAGCAPEATPPVVSDAEATSLADRLLDAGQAELALALLDAYQLGDEGDAARYVVDALVLLERFEEAHARLDALGDAGHAEQRMDACAMGALSAWAGEDEERASRLLAPCEGLDRVDLHVLGLRARHHLAEVLELTELGAASRRVLGAEASPERDLAAAELEALLLALSESEQDPFRAIELRRRAFEIGRDPAMAAALIAGMLQTAEAIGEERPQDAATLYERLYLGQTAGLRVPEDAMAQARAGAEEVLLPVYYSNFEPRYLRKFADDDEASGLLERESLTFTFPPPRDASARDALVRWLYARAERPVPTPMADLSGAVGCEAADAPCTFSLLQLATVAYRFGDLEQAWAEREGVTLDYP